MPQNITLNRIRVSCGQPPLCDCLPYLVCKEIVRQFDGWGTTSSKEFLLFARICLPSFLLADLFDPCFCPDVVFVWFPATNLTTIMVPKQWGGGVVFKPRNLDIQATNIEAGATLLGNQILPDAFPVAKRLEALGITRIPQPIAVR